METQHITENEQVLFEIEADAAAKQMEPLPIAFSDVSSADVRSLSISDFRKEDFYKTIDALNYGWDITEIEDSVPKNGLKRRIKKLCRRLVFLIMGPKIIAQAVYNAAVFDAFVSVYALAEENEAMRQEADRLRETIAALSERINTHQAT